MELRIYENSCWTFVESCGDLVKETGKYLFFSPDRKLLFDILEKEITENDFTHGKISITPIHDEYALCLFWIDDSRKVEMRKRYKESNILKYRWWKSHEQSIKDFIERILC